MKTFAEKIIDSMVDENGHCGELGLSEKQFDILYKRLHINETIQRGGWSGDYSGIDFSEDIWEGTIGCYNVKLSCFHHFHNRYTVVSIDKWIDELPDFENSEFVGEIESRIERIVTFIGESSYERKAYTYGWETVYIYKFADEFGVHPSIVRSLYDVMPNELYDGIVTALEDMADDLGYEELFDE